MKSSIREEARAREYQARHETRTHLSLDKDCPETRTRYYNGWIQNRFPHTQELKAALLINTGTTIVTFLMVFLIQNSQNRDNSALQVKLDELIRVSTVQNIFVGIERLSDEELEQVRAKCEARAQAEERGQEEVEKVHRRAEEAAEKA